jgi:cysteate synthase
MLPINDQEARKQVEEINAKVLSNRKPPYSIIGGLYDALKDAGGEVFAVTNQEGAKAAQLFLETEGNDIEPAAAVAVASLIKAIEEGKTDKNATVMLNITGGGIEKFKLENTITYLDPLLVFPLNPDPQSVFDKIKSLF